MNEAEKVFDAEMDALAEGQRLYSSLRGFLTDMQRGHAQAEKGFSKLAKSVASHLENAIFEPVNDIWRFFKKKFDDRARNHRNFTLDLDMHLRKLEEKSELLSQVRSLF